MAVKRFKVEKLIRDRMPEILHEKEIVVDARIMDEQEYIEKLKDKLIEEATEVEAALNREEVIEELADLFEVMQSLARAAGISMQEIEDKRLLKREAKGGFDRKIYNHFIDIEESNSAISYYRNALHQYPESDLELPRYPCDNEGSIAATR